jgi:uncharacterized cupredoxin-like copper-binding protein
MTIRFLAVASAALLTLAGAGAASAGTRVATVRVTAKDFSYVLSTKTVRHGRVMFVIKNAGRTTHDFSIAGHTSKMVAPGKTATMTVTLKRGHLSYRCTVDSHANLGMKGILKVT